MSERNPGIFAGNSLKLGVFGPNCSGGLAFTKLPERWDASWENNLRLARLADAAGLECIVPLGRWKGYGGETNVNGTSFETITWASGLLAQTRDITIFGTVHVPLFHPVLAAKQMVTADHIGTGRFGLNIVCGWNAGEFAMFGVAQQEHDIRYSYGEEWWKIIKKIWLGNGPFDHKGEFFQLTGVEGSPRPYSNADPVMMNAATSPAGRKFAIRNSDLHFDGCTPRPEDCIDRIKESKRLAREYNRTLQVWTPVSMICRSTQKQVDDYVQRCRENADWAAINHLLEGLTSGESGTRSAARSAQVLKASRERKDVGWVLSYGGGYSLLGDPENIAQQLSHIHNAGFDGVVMSCINYLEDIPLFIEEVLPRLEAMGLRRPHRQDAG